MRGGRRGALLGIGSWHAAARAPTRAQERPRQDLLALRLAA